MTSTTLLHRLPSKQSPPSGMKHAGEVQGDFERLKAEQRRKATIPKMQAYSDDQHWRYHECMNETF
jgi:hypothetical protein